MKRELYGGIKLMPYESATVVDRDGFLSAVLSAQVTVAGTLVVGVTHCDTEAGTFTAPTDPNMILYGPGAAAVGDLVTVAIDLIGLKQFVNFAISGVTATYALALGDPGYAPVEG